MAPLPERDAAAAGFDAARLQEACAWAERHDSGVPESLDAYLAASAFQDRDWGETLGPTKDRGPCSGLVLKDGAIVAAWGDPHRIDMTFSVTKSMLAAVAGVAFDSGLLSDLDEPVGAKVKSGHFDGPHNGAITWRHLLQQASEWEGTLWDKPDLVDRNRDVFGKDNSKKATHRDLQAPGSFWEYNDVRVNVLALALLHLFRRPLPEVAREAILDPIGASQELSWNGYRNSTVTIDGEEMLSVSGGGHWGGGMFVSADDLARFGLLFLNRGHWGGRRILSERWVDLCTTPSAIEPRYGFLWWLNTGRGMYPSAPESSFFALGNGGHLVWVDRDNGIVGITRWMADAAHDGFIRRVLDARA
jgi:CubicO group peptidase (beta-lactamase class C family)